MISEIKIAYDLSERMRERSIVDACADAIDEIERAIQDIVFKRFPKCATVIITRDGEVKKL